MNQEKPNILDELDDLIELWPFTELSCEIPTSLHSLKDGPFTKCLICDVDLIDSSVRYYVERIFRGTEPIVEYAMCLKCHEAICSELSKESMEAIHDIYQGIDFMTRCDRLRPLIRESADPASIHAAFYDELRLDVDINPWLDTCYLTEKPRVECSGYQYVAMCRGESLELGVVPIMLSNDAVEDIMKVMSKSTRERLDDFIGDHFGMPPEYCENPDSFPLLV